MPSDFDRCAEFVPQGWQCPACKRVHAPFVSNCDCQKPKVAMKSGGSNTSRWFVSNPWFTLAIEDPTPELT